jgi:lysophospholipase L1-like esterase
MVRAGLGTALPFLSAGLSACASAVVAPLRRRAVAARAPLSGPLTYVAIGASDTEGWGVPAPRRDGWVPVLAGHLPQPAEVVNLGVGGTTLRRALDGQLPEALRAQPHLVTVWLAVNDVLRGVPLDQYRADLDHLLGTLRAETGAVVAVGNLPYPPASLDPWGFPDIVRRSVAGAWNTVIGETARRHGAIVVDLFRRWPLHAHPEFIGEDGLHPTVAGYRALADVFLGVLRTEGVLA